VEEEALFGNIVDKLKKAGESGLFALENDLGHKRRAEQ
jgi:ferritin